MRSDENVTVATNILLAREATMKKAIQHILMVFAIMVSVPVCAESAATGGPATYPDPERFHKWIEAFVEADRSSPPVERGIVAVGSSSMVGWHKTIQKDLAPLTIIQRGFGGSNMNDVLHYVDKVVTRYRPRAVLLYEGDNDVAGGIDPDQILETFARLREKIHASVPDVRIYVLSIKPSIARWAMWPTMQEANRLLETVCDMDDRLTFIDIGATMLNAKGEPRKDIFLEDMLHMNDTGYRLWTATVRPVLVGAERSYEAQ